MSDLYARVRPLVGEALHDRQVIVLGSHAAISLVESLVACGVQHWATVNGSGWMEKLIADLCRRYGGVVELTLDTAACIEVVGAADLALVVDDVEAAKALPLTLPRLVIFTPTNSRPVYAFFAMAGERFDLPRLSKAAPSCSWEWSTAAPLMALAARALLLRGTIFAVRTWEEAWAKGARVYTVGDAHDPTCARWDAHLPTVQAARVQPIYHTPHRRQGTLLIVGLGALGSVAAQQLAPCVERIVLVDPDRVEAENLVRQAYSFCQVGEAKATALAKTIGMAHPEVLCEAVLTSLTSEEEVVAILQHFGVTAALVTTGTYADFAICRALRAASIPHVAGRCYARARFWEGIVVDGASGPSYEGVRRGVEAGPIPAPTPEERMAYGATGELAAEPATAMETGWAALWLARLAVQLMAPATLREGWFLARLAAGATCFIGGLVVEQGEDGAAYGMETPGTVHAWAQG
jgi:hypothetical protein